MTDGETLAKIKEIVDKIKPPIDREDEETGCVIIDDWAGGNIDDAYQLGETDGEAYLAERIREILE